ncbi:MAG: MerR family transcriptional regulator [Spirochaetae bacterium HGW-Spirochaetae-7]|nr:MAG: MerR family transcriptional regulator [Spirochaetae bacterium HGW-Spirochaetae-7]
MERDEKRSIGAVATIAGVSVRTLRLYDELGLVSPSGRTPAGYRQYDEAALLRLQQVLLYRELDVPLDEVRRILDTPGFEALEALNRHRHLLELRTERLSRLIATVDRTMNRIKGEGSMMTVEELYEGFDKATIERYEREARKQWGDTLAYEQSRKRTRSMSKDEWKRVGTRGAALESAFAAAFTAGAKPDGPEAAGLCASWAEHLRAFYDPNPEILAGLGRMYADHPEFRARYEAMAPGLADWLAAALEAYSTALKRSSRA